MRKARKGFGLSFIMKRKVKDFFRLCINRWIRELWLSQTHVVNSNFLLCNGLNRINAIVTLIEIIKLALKHTQL